MPLATIILKVLHFEGKCSSTFWCVSLQPGFHPHNGIRWLQIIWAYLQAVNRVHFCFLISTAIDDTRLVFAGVIQNRDGCTSICQLSQMGINRGDLAGVFAALSRLQKTGPAIEDDPWSMASFLDAVGHQCFEPWIAWQRWRLLSETVPYDQVSVLRKPKVQVLVSCFDDVGGILVIQIKHPATASSLPEKWFALGYSTRCSHHQRGLECAALREDQLEIAFRDEVLDQPLSAVGAPSLPKLKEDGTLSPRHGVPRNVLKVLETQGVRQGALGYFDATAHKPCHKTPLTIRRPELLYRNKDLVKRVAKLYAKYAPVPYALQLAEVKKCPCLRLWKTAFTTLYAIKSLRCAYHYDSGNLRGVMSALMPMGHFTGGELVLPRWRRAIAFKPGDLLLFDPQQLHGNLPVTGERLSAILYCERRIALCCQQRIRRFPRT